MGCLPSSEERLAKQKSKEIDKFLKKDFQKTEKSLKLILLGAGESGKSTLIKQIRIIFENDYTKEERESFKCIIFENTINAMFKIIKGMGDLDLTLGNNDLIKDIKFLLAYDFENYKFTNLPCAVAESLFRLWHDHGIKEAYKRSREFGLCDSAEYYLNSLERFAHKDYLPTQQDILRSRVKTTGVSQMHFYFKGTNFNIFDVGGQRSERKKWIHCFEGVTAVIFVVALSEYDLGLLEDIKINRLKESINLFDSISNNKYFEKSGIILFLNKKDLFIQKLKVSKISDYFSDFEGKNNFEDGLKFIESKLLQSYHNKSKPIYTHVTCATDTDIMHNVFDDVTSMIIEKNLEWSRLL